VTARTERCPWCGQSLRSENRRIPAHANLGGRPCKSGLTFKFAAKLRAYSDERSRAAA
jgi:hypothetical protein